ncbi:MAG: phosphatase [Ruminococcus sp.]|nr:phosphatase [Ruminococcus sp.]MBQ7133395.1 phosphatase [Ruminococcus sp.]
MNIIADLHTHTNACTHAYSTIDEMVQAAAKKNLSVIAITDHGRAMEGAPGAYYFESLSLVPKELYGVRVLKGMEANIIDYDGSLDCSEKLLHSLEWIVASMHSITLLKEPSVEKCTGAYLAMCDNPNVNVIGHSGSPYYAYEYETVIKRCAETSTLVEINNATFTGFRKDSIPNCRKIAQLCKKHSARVVVDTDAHFASSVGEFSHALQLLSEVDFPKELVVNSSIENLREYCKEKNIKL